MASTQESVRFASFNASLNRSSEGQLIADLSTANNAQAKNVAEIIQRVNPDVVLINEFDFDAAAEAAQLFQQNYLGVSQSGVDPVEYPYVYVAPSNTGIPSGFDFNNNGSTSDPDDAYGFGFYPGQFGMVLYSKYPIATEQVRTFQTFLWKDMPGALLPDDPNTPQPADWYSPAELEVFRLSSKNHWDVPIEVNGEIIHVLASHPTPPVFDGPEDRNGRRNHDEIRFWADYIAPGQGDYIYDDAGNPGGLQAGSQFVIMGDQNADPFDGDSFDFAIRQLTDNPDINNSVVPDSAGSVDATERQNAINNSHIGNPAFDTADFADTTPGNLRVDYVLPSANLAIADAAVFWTPNEDPLFRLIGDFDPAVPPTGFPASDHRLVWADLVVDQNDRQTVSNLDFLGEVTFPTGLQFENTVVGGLSGIVYDAENQVYYSLSDDRSQTNPARFYTLDIDFSDGSLDAGDVSFEDITTLLDANGNPFAPLSLDPEGITLTDAGTLYITSEGDANAGVAPFVNEFSLTGQQLDALPVPDKFLPTDSSGIRNNLAFESLTITPDNRYLYTATENALVQDGAAADLENESPARILKYDLTTGQPVAEFLYFTDPVAAASIPPGGFQTNGLVELLAIDNAGTLLSLERSFSAGVGNSIKLYEVRLQGATDISSIDSLNGLEVDAPAQKRLLLDFADLGIPLDNIEGMTLGETLPDGRQSLVVVSDNNFSDTQFTQFLTFAIDFDTVPSVVPVVETPPVIDLDEPPNNQQPGDADDPAIYVHPTDVEQSIVIGTLKDGGLSVYDLNGEIVQTILPGAPGDVRYNNVDLVYNFDLNGTAVDLAIASDRRNDTLAIFQIDPATRNLTDITSSEIPASIFGIDDGEQTAYGLATYTSPVTGKSYVFVSQREGDRVAQLELSADGSGSVTAEVVRTLTVPIPTGGELEDAQVEGMVADRQLGYLYVGQENGGIFKFSAEPGGDTIGTLIEAVQPDGSVLVADVEGLTIYYANDDTGYLLASSQGDSTYAVFTREGDNDYLGSFAIGDSGNIDGVAESDGADVVNVPLGSQFPFGLLVVQDGFDDPSLVVVNDAEVESVSSNFKFVPWQSVATAFPDFLKIDTTSYNPRTAVLVGNDQANQITGSDGSNRINGLAGDDTIAGGLGNDVLTGGGDNDTFVLRSNDGIDTITDFGGVGTGVRRTGRTAREADVLKFEGAGLTARNLLLTQSGSDLIVSFEGSAQPQVILQNFELEDLDNLPASPNLGNILFDGQDRFQDSFDVFDADDRRSGIFQRNSVTFLNDLDNTVRGYARSQDVINGQGGDDRLEGLSGDDLLRGGAGNDTLVGGAGNDTLVGGAGQDRFVLAVGQGTDTVTDFTQGEDQLQVNGATFNQLTIAPGTGANAGDTLIQVGDETIAILTGIPASSLGSTDFAIG
jgi:3-phytase/alkaline phosphatase D